MNKKGFTLLELLAIILVLGIITLIAIPTVNVIMTKAKLGANKATGNNFIDTAKKKCQMSNINGEKMKGVYHLTDFASEISGGKGVTGKIEISDNCEVELIMEADNTSEYCYVKSFTDDDIKTYKDKEKMGCSTSALESTPESCFTYTESNGQITLTGYKCGGQVASATDAAIDDDNLAHLEVLSYTNGTHMNVVIPSYINGKPVTKIEHGTFSIINNVPDNPADVDIDFNKKVIIESVVVPSTVKVIEPVAFAINAIKSISLSEGLAAIADSAFAYNKIEGGVYIPDSVEYLGGTSFAYNKITSVAIGKKVTSLRTFVFAHNQLTTVNIPEGITIINGKAFRDNKITGILTIPSTVTEVKDNAFMDNNIGKVILEGTTSKLGYRAFGINKNANSNVNLTIIVNKTGKAFDWKYVTFGSTGDSTFETGTVTKDGISVNIIK